MRIVTFVLISGILLSGCGYPQGDPSSEKKGGHRLKAASSPYLRQHQNDAVEWHEWGDEAFALARKLDKPIFLSIGYSACHWCHVMQHESFQNADVAALLNKVCIPIKLDREERPDVDTIYMDACHAMGIRGGWPLSAFLNHDRTAFLVRTYDPPARFKEILRTVDDAWKNRREDLQKVGDRIVQRLKEQQAVSEFASLPDLEIFDNTAGHLITAEDKTNGGFGTAPKFPMPSAPLFLMRQVARSGDQSASDAVRRMLDALIAGGIRDHLEGGFHRYSTDAAWKVPHFEKMLYDQALLAQLFTEASQVFRSDRYRKAAEEILGFCQLKLRQDEGGYISALDADADGVEGLTYVWTMEELTQHLSEAELQVIKSWCGATSEGNWEHGRNILYESVALADVAKSVGKSQEEVRAWLESAKGKLLQARAHHPQPHRDTKVIVAWNALLASAYAKAGRAFGRQDYISEASSILKMLHKTMRQENGRYFRTRDLGRSAHPATLRDYGALGLAYLDLHEANLDLAALTQAKEVAEVIISDFRLEDGTFVDSRQKDLIHPVRGSFDGAMPTGNSLGLLALVRFGIMAQSPRHLELARLGFRGFESSFRRSPASLPHALIGVDLLIRPAPRVGVTTMTTSTDRPAILKELDRTYHPFAFVAADIPEPGVEPSEILAEVCLDQRCLEPARTPEELAARLKEAIR